MAKLSQSDMAMTIALVLIANQRPLTIDEIHAALTGAGYEVAARETMQALDAGPFRCCAGKWVLAMASS